MESRIFLIGFMGSGKSTLGLKLARKIGYSFMDMDQLIEETAGMTIPGIFRELGEEVFRKWEHDILLELCASEKVVISTGGGAPCHKQMMQIMNEHGATVYIKLSPEALKNRLQNSRTERPLIQGKSDEELLRFIRSKLAEREFYYTQASHTVDGVNLKPEELISVLRD
ncbi:MAG: shikimate kinase [Bacteroidota bacterium]